MKKSIIIFLALISALLVTDTFASSETTKQSENRTYELFDFYTQDSYKEFIIPESVEIIEEEAFEGTAIVKVKLPETVTTIGDRAFANIQTLRSIRIPIETQFIASSAFEGSIGVTINAIPDSYARKYAKAQGLPYAPVATFTASSSGTAMANRNRSEGRSKEVIDTGSTDEIENNKQWKRTEEKDTTPNIECLGKQILSRGPPMS